METKDAITLALAVYGAGLSNYNIFQALQRDRKRVKVTMNTAMYVFGGDLGPPTSFANVHVLLSQHELLVSRYPGA
jgi:hypothetical protein